MTWVVVPAAGRGERFGSDLPKQYLSILGRPLLTHTLERLARHPGVTGLLVVHALNDPHYPGWRELHGKPVLACVGGATRADSVLAGLEALPSKVSGKDWVLVHDAARPCLRQDDLTRLLAHGCAHAVGAVLAAPVHDTLKRSNDAGEIVQTEPRAQLWRALTPQLFRRATLTRAVQAAIAAGDPVTDESMAIERLGLSPMVVEGADDNVKLTTPADAALIEFVLGRMGTEA